MREQAAVGTDGRCFSRDPCDVAIAARRAIGIEPDQIAVPRAAGGLLHAITDIVEFASHIARDPDFDFVIAFTDRKATARIDVQRQYMFLLADRKSTRLNSSH